MDNSTNDSMDEPLDFLLQPEKIKIFIEMFEKRIGAGENQLEQIKGQGKQVEDAIRGLKSKLENLQNYSKFMDLKGFAYTKQESDAYFKEMKAAQDSRLSAEEPPDDPWKTPKVNIPTPPVDMWNDASPHCGQFYQLSNGLVGTCTKPPGHQGECSP